MTAVSIQDACVRYGDFSALGGVSLDVASGEFLTLLGPSGCGKTTLLKAIAGFVPLTSGRITIGGLDMANCPPERRDTAMCFQSYALFPHLSVAENILFGPRQKRAPVQEQVVRLDETAAQLSLQSQLAKLPGELSGGQQQRVALARALAIRPGVILFDEPLSNLDAKLREQVRFEIRTLQRRIGFTAIYVTHDQSEALAMSDRVAVMNGGKVQQIGAPEDIYRRPASRFVAEFVGSANLLAGVVAGRTGKGETIFGTALGPLSVATQTEPSLQAQDCLCIRPEDLRVGAGPVNAFEAVVLAKAFLGHITEYALGLSPDGPVLLRFQTMESLSLPEGARAQFHIPSDRILALGGVAT